MDVPPAGDPMSGFGAILFPLVLPQLLDDAFCMSITPKSDVPTDLVLSVSRVLFKQNARFGINTKPICASCLWIQSVG